MQLRVCFVSNFLASGRGFDSHGYAHSIVGPNAAYVRRFLGLDILTHSHNNSLLFYPSKTPGSERNGNGIYDGCIGALQQGKADVASHFFPFPILAPNLTQGPAILQYGSSFVSSYKPSATRSSPDLLEYVSALSAVSSACYLIACLILSLLIWLSQKRQGMTRKRKRMRQRTLVFVAWVVVAHMLGNFQTNMRRRRIRILFALLLFLAFMYKTQSYLTMNTEKVVRSPAVKLCSMQQLFDRNITFAWTSQIEFDIFKKTANSDMKKMFHASTSKGVRNVLLDQFREVDNNRKLIDGVLRHHHVMVSEQPIQMMRVMCILADRHNIPMGDHVLIHTRLKDSPHPIAGVVMSKHTNPITARHLVRTIRISTSESYLMGGYQRRLRRKKVIDRKIKKSIARCFRRIGEPKASFALFTPGIWNLKRLLLVSCGLLALSAATLSMERLRARIVRRWNHRFVG